MPLADRKCPAGLFTIVEVNNGWARLKSGAGRILLSKTENLNVFLMVLLCYNECDTPGLFRQYWNQSFLRVCKFIGCNDSYTSVYFGNDKVLEAGIKPEEVKLVTGRSYTLEASCIGGITSVDSCEWSIDNDRSDCSVQLGEPFVRNEKSYCRITASEPGTCYVTVNINSIYSATTKIIITEDEKPVTTITAVAGQAQHQVPVVTLDGVKLIENKDYEERGAGR